MAEQTDISVKFEKKTYNVPLGFTAEEFCDSLAASNPKAIGAKLIKDGDGAYTLKPKYESKG